VARVKNFSRFVKENFELPGWISEEPQNPNQREPQTEYGDNVNYTSDDDELYYYWLNNLEDSDYDGDDNDDHYDDEDR
jgi:hypothetical protein